ncbi:MAG: class I SAM-dependent methyltransferase [Desulfovibrio sp.]|uniref:class I SAM-dependent methyltransferase n=1 Tax=Desulfovibrio sp. TaxID=885 RepID=UPI0039E3FEF5
MRRSYQWHWHYIPFFSFAELSFFKIAGTSFYSSFYEEFQKRYTSPDKLSEPYKLFKEESLENILQHIDIKDKKKVLSISCGNGYVEYRLLQERPNTTVYCTELSDNIPSFLDKKFLKENLRVGFVPKCLKKEEKFDIICIIEVDYTLTNAQWVTLLKDIRHYLNDDGIITIHSTYQRHSFSSFRCIEQPIANMKALFSHFILKKNTQFWGWKRSIQEHLSLCEKANLPEVDIKTKGEALILTYYKEKYSTRNKMLLSCYLSMAERMHGEQVWFWGAGAAYKYYRQSLACLCPQGMILSPEFAQNTPAIDGMPVISPATAAARGKQLPIILFTRAQHQDIMLEQIWAYFGSNAQIHPVILY